MMKRLLALFGILCIIGGLVLFKIGRDRERARREAERVPPRLEKTITIIEGWSVRDIAKYFVKNGIIANEEALYELTGQPADTDTSVYPPLLDFSMMEDKPKNLSLEGYLFPDTYRIYEDSTPEDVLMKLLGTMEVKFDSELRAEMKKRGFTIHETLTIASILESEVRASKDRALVADILERRLKNGWPLQMDSTVNYVTGSNRPSATYAELENASPWNTYKYRELPPGPIANPGLDAIRATVRPEKNPYWFFLTSPDGTVYYAKTLEEHAANKRYLK